MELLVLNSNFESVYVLDVFDSLIWTDRYSAYGDFEIYTPVSSSLLSHVQQDYYLWFNDSDHTMIIEDAQIKQDIEEGNYLILTGRSLESILDRRIVWGQTILTGNFQNAIGTLLNDAIISPTISDRVISNFIFEPSIDPVITALTIDAQIARGTNLYTAIQTLCSQNNIGFKITLSDTNQFIFKLYAGVDRSYEQFTNPYVVFSPNFDNLINADYAESKKTLKTVTVVAGEGEETVRKTTVVGSGSSLSRRELYTDANDLSQNNGETVLTDEEYLAQLIQRGIEDLSKHTINKAFDSEIDSISNPFKYYIDYFIGDVIQISSDYGIESRARVTEIIFSQSKEGSTTHPTLSIMDVGEVEADGVLIPGTGGGTDGEIEGNGLQAINLLTNGGFEIWQRGAGAFTGTSYNADRWINFYTGTSTLSTQREDTVKKPNSLYSLKATAVKGNYNCQVYQQLKITDGYHQLLDQKVSFKISVKTNVPNAVDVGIVTDGTGGVATLSGNHSGGDAWEELTVENKSIPINATYIQVYVRIKESCTVYIDNAMLVVGGKAADYVTLHPAEEMQRCQRYYEVHGGQTYAIFHRSNASAGGVGYAITLPMLVEKPVTPTVTKNGTWLVGNCSQPIVLGYSKNNYTIAATALASGDMHFCTVDATTTITIEANP